MCAAALALAAMAGSASAEVNTVRIAETYGLTHLPIYVIVDEHLIEKEAAKRGLGPISVELQRVSIGNVITDLVLSGRADVAMSGVIPFLALWDKVRATRPIRGIAALSDCNVFLMTTDSKIKSISDYGSNDRIAMTGVKSTTWAILLQMEAAKKFGWDERNKFTPLSVSMANSEAAAAMLSGRTEVRSHMTMLPYTAVERKSGHIRSILSSRDILGGPYTATMAFTTEKFHDQNPKLYSAIAAAYEEAAKFTNDNPERAAEIYQKHEPQKGGVPAILNMMSKDQPDQLTFTTTPHGIAAFANFMHRSGLMKTEVSSWKEFFFENMSDKQGS
jgi:NitT/TauT family transport system substrate-binding protein